MKSKFSFLILLLFIFQSYNILAQDKAKEEATEILNKGIQIMDQGNLDEAIQILEKGQKKFPKILDFPYEIGYSYYLKKEYSKTITYLTPLLTHSDITYSVFQLLGNAYDMNGDAAKSSEIYTKGLEKFPNSGALYVELGNLEYYKKNYDQAIAIWEKGTKKDPNYASNYYCLAKIFNFSEERMWTIMYSEIFINLEPNSKRTKEISKALYENYKKCYEVKSDTSGEFKLSKQAEIIDGSNKKEMDNLKKGILPFPGTYCAAFAFSGISLMAKIDMSTIYNTRKEFLHYWFTSKKFDKIYPNKLFDFQKEIEDKNLTEPYIYWLLSEGNPNEFLLWYANHKEVFTQFSNWFQKSKLKLDEKDSYSRIDY